MKTMAILKEFTLKMVLNNAYEDKTVAIHNMKKSIKTCMPLRQHPIARSRIKSAIRIIREFSDNKGN